MGKVVFLFIHHNRFSFLSIIQRSSESDDLFFIIFAKIIHSPSFFSMEKNAKIYIAGHRGMVGSAIRRKLEAEGYTNFVVRTSRELDLRNQQAVNDFFEQEKPDYVFLAAAKVGGIHANNTQRGAFIYDNLMIQNNVIHAAYLNDVKKLMFLGSSCIYPKLADQPLREDYLLTGALEPTNEPYAIAKIAGIKMCDAYRHQYACNFISVRTSSCGERVHPSANFSM